MTPYYATSFTNGLMSGAEFVGLGVDIHCEQHPEERADLVYLASEVETLLKEIRTELSHAALCAYISAHAEHLRYLNREKPIFGQATFDAIERDYNLVINVMDKLDKVLDKADQPS